MAHINPIKLTYGAVQVFLSYFSVLLNLYHLLDNMCSLVQCPLDLMLLLSLLLRLGSLLDRMCSIHGHMGSFALHLLDLMLLLSLLLRLGSLLDRMCSILGYMGSFALHLLDLPC